MVISSVSFEGLTKQIAQFEDVIPQKCSQTMAGWTRELGEELLRLYRENLSGDQPSTADDPLPVGIVSGDLLAGAELRVLNQYSFEVVNAVPYSGFIEDGTEKMAPRRPLQNAADVQALHFDSDMQGILVEFMEG